MDIKNPTAITNLSKWTEKTVELVRRTCSKKPGPCVALAMLFLDGTAPAETKWNLVVQLAADPNAPLPEKERELLSAALEHIMAGALQILDDGEGGDHEIEQYTAKASLH
jgi:hypothetical protein